MSGERKEEGGVVFSTTPEIEFAQLAARKGALKLEVLGMKRSGKSAYAICKEVYGLKGTKRQVLEQMERLVEEAIEKRRNGNF